MLGVSAGRVTHMLDSGIRKGHPQGAKLPTSLLSPSRAVPVSRPSAGRPQGAHGLESLRPLLASHCSRVWRINTRCAPRPEAQQVCWAQRGGRQSRTFPGIAAASRWPCPCRDGCGLEPQWQHELIKCLLGRVRVSEETHRELRFGGARQNLRDLGCALALLGL